MDRQDPVKQPVDFAERSVARAQYAPLDGWAKENDHERFDKYIRTIVQQYSTFRISKAAFQLICDASRNYLMDTAKEKADLRVLFEEKKRFDVRLALHFARQFCKQFMELDGFGQALFANIASTGYALTRKQPRRISGYSPRAMIQHACSFVYIFGHLEIGKAAYKPKRSKCGQVNHVLNAYIQTLMQIWINYIVEKATWSINRDGLREVYTDVLPHINIAIKVSVEFEGDELLGLNKWPEEPIFSETVALSTLYPAAIGALHRQWNQRKASSAN